MIAVKRIEIVIDALAERLVTDLLAQHGHDGWTSVRGVSGFGQRGLRRDDGITDVASNVLLITTCAPDLLSPLLAALRPLLQRAGGMCLVSDAQWLRH